jgi:hypothetical protein
MVGSTLYSLLLLNKLLFELFKMNPKLIMINSLAEVVLLYKYYSFGLFRQSI